MESHTCHLSLFCWPASLPVGPWQRSWSWSSSSCSSTSPGWISACLEATHKHQNQYIWVLNIENVFENSGLRECACFFPSLSPFAGCGESSCRGNWRLARTALYPPQSTRLERAWSWPGRQVSAPHRVCAIITCRVPEGTEGTRTGSGSQRKWQCQKRERDTNKQ